MPKAIGIDLGTTYSCVAVHEGKDKPTVIHNEHGNWVTPSVVHFDGSDVTVGEAAVEEKAAHPENVISQVKRFIGRLAVDMVIKSRWWPFTVSSDDKGVANITVPTSGQEKKKYCPEEISAMILRHMKNIAEEYLGEPATDAVITVPSNFNDAQRVATRDAGKIAGLKVLRIINEPTAAALAYGLNKNDGKTRKILVYDLGGGTFDVSIVEMKGMNARVLATDDDKYANRAWFSNPRNYFTGRRRFDYRLCQEAIKRFEEMDVIIGPKDVRLLQECERAKKTLSLKRLASIGYTLKDETRKSFAIKRIEFEELCEDLFEKTIECVRNAMKSAEIEKDALDDIILVGGSTRIPRVREMLKELFPNHSLRCDIQPDHAVAMGAAILAYSLEEKCSVKLDVTGVRLEDVTPHSLGVGCVNDKYSILIKKNTVYPVDVANNTFSNAKDNQTSILFRIYEGEMALASQNRLLGTLNITVPPRKEGENHFKVTFSIDKDGDCC